MHFHPLRSHASHAGTSESRVLLAEGPKVAQPNNLADELHLAFLSRPWELQTMHRQAGGARESAKQTSE